MGPEDESSFWRLRRPENLFRASPGGDLWRVASRCNSSHFSFRPGTLSLSSLRLPRYCFKAFVSTSFSFDSKRKCVTFSKPIYWHSLSRHARRATTRTFHVLLFCIVILSKLASLLCSFPYLLNAMSSLLFRQKSLLALKLSNRLNLHDTHPVIIFSLVVMDKNLL